MAESRLKSDLGKGLDTSLGTGERKPTPCRWHLPSGFELTTAVAGRRFGRPDAAAVTARDPIWSYARVFDFVSHAKGGVMYLRLFRKDRERCP
jgi:hypothetical protein